MGVRSVADLAGGGSSDGLRFRPPVVEIDPARVKVPQPCRLTPRPLASSGPLPGGSVPGGTTWWWWAVAAPTLLTRAAAPGMVARGEGTIINVAGMLAFSGPAPAQGRATYVATLAHLVALSQALHQELKSQGLRIQVLCPGVVATEFHERQGMDLSAVPRMSAEDVVSASLRGLALGEVVCAPGVERSELLDAVFGADLAVFAAQAPQLAQRYRTA